MNSTTSPTGLYSGGLGWVDPPGAAAGSVKPRDRAGPGPPKARVGAPPLSPAVRGRLQPQLAAGARLGAAAGPAGALGNQPGLGHGGARGLSEPPPGGARASAAREREGRRACPFFPAGWGRAVWDRQGRPRRSEAAGTSRAGWSRARRSARARRPGTGRSGLGKAAGAGRPCRGCCAGPRCVGACRGVEFEQLFASVIWPAESAARWCATRLAWAECTMIIRLTGMQCRYGK